MSTLKVGVAEKKGTCLKLRQQLESLERETAAKLAEMDQYNKDVQVIIKWYHNIRQNGFLISYFNISFWIIMRTVSHVSSQHIN